MVYKIYTTFILTLFLLIPAISLHGDSTNDIDQWLVEAGYSTDNYQAELQWVEYTKIGEVIGVLLYNNMTDEYEEVYFTYQGNLLNEDELRELDIRSKNWFPDIIDIPAEIGEQKKTFYLSKGKSYSTVSKKQLPLGVSKYTLNLPVPRLIADNVEPQQEKGLLKIGEVIHLDTTFALFDKSSLIDFAQEEAEGYSIYSLNLFAEDALGIKLHLVFPSLLPPLHRVYIKGKGNDENLIPISVNDKAVWAPLVFSSDVTLFYVMQDFLTTKQNMILV